MSLLTFQVLFPNMEKCVSSVTYRRYTLSINLLYVFEARSRCVFNTNTYLLLARCWVGSNKFSSRWAAAGHHVSLGPEAVADDVGDDWITFMSSQGINKAFYQRENTS